MSQYQLNRLRSFVDPSADPQASGYQLRQARITIGSGGFFGKGLFDGPQTNGRFVPEQHTDFIFTVAGEEIGFLGAGLILLLYIVILMRAFSIARRTNDLFGKPVHSQQSLIQVNSWNAYVHLPWIITETTTHTLLSFSSLVSAK